MAEAATPTPEEIARFRRWECEVRGHSFSTIQATGSNSPLLISCTNCGESWDVVQRDDDQDREGVRTEPDTPEGRALDYLAELITAVHLLQNGVEGAMERVDEAMALPPDLQATIERRRREQQN